MNTGTAKDEKQPNASWIVVAAPERRFQSGILRRF